MIRALVAIALLAETAHAGGAATPAPAPKAPAEPAPDRAAQEAGEGANLEPDAPRDGFVATISLIAGGVTVGIGMENATGQGNAGLVRLAHVATPRTMIVFEIVYNALIQIDGDDLYGVHSINMLAGAQRYVKPALWLRGAAGAGLLYGEEDRVGGLIRRPAVENWGPAVSGGAGVDLFRWKWLRGSVEYCVAAMYNSDGVVLSNTLLFGAGFD